MNFLLVAFFGLCAMAYAWFDERLALSRGDVTKVWLSAIAGASSASLWVNWLTALLTVLILVGSLIFTILKVMLVWRAWKRDSKIELE